MHIDEKIEEIQNFTKRKITYDEIGQVLGVTRSAIQNRIKRGTPLKAYEESILDEHYKMTQNVPKYDFTPLTFSDFLGVPYWEGLPDDLKISDVSCVTVEKSVITNHWNLKPESLRIVPMVGNKMADYWYRINDNDILIIDTSHDYIMGNGVYFATSQNNTRFWVREMQVLVNNDVEFKGFAPSGNTTRVVSREQLEEVGFRIVGKVIKNVSFRL